MTGIRYKTEKRHAQHNLKRLDDLNRAYLMGGQGVLPALADFDKELPQFERTRDWAVKHSAAHDDAKAIAEDMVDVGSDILLLRLPPVQMWGWVQDAITAAEQLESQRALCVHTTTLGIVERRLNHFEAASVAAERSLALAHALGDAELVAMATGGLANILQETGDGAAAESHYRRALELALRTGDQRRVAIWQGNLGTLFSRRGDYPAAYDRFQQALVAHQLVEDVRSTAYTLDNMGTALSQMGRGAEAVGHHQAALKLVLELKDTEMIGNVCGNFGVTLRRLGNYRQSLELHQRALRAFESVEDIPEQLVEHEHLATVNGILGDYNAAFQHYQALGALAKLVDSRAYAIVSEVGIGKVAHRIGELQLAVDTYAHALQLAAEGGDVQQQHTLYGLIGQVLFDAEQYEAAADHHRQAIALAESIGESPLEHLGNLGNAFQHMGQLEAAINTLERTRSLAGAAERGRLIAVVTGNLGNCYLAQDNLTAARDAYEEALTAATRMDDRRNMGNWHGNLGVVYAQLGAVEQARTHYAAAREIYAALGLDTLVKHTQDNEDLTLPPNQP